MNACVVKCIILHLEALHVTIKVSFSLAVQPKFQAMLNLIIFHTLFMCEQAQIFKSIDPLNREGQFTDIILSGENYIMWNFVICIGMRI